MRIFALVLLGLVCLSRLPVDLLPAVSIPTVAIVTNWTNVPPEEMETQITRPIEEAVSSVENMRLVSSSSDEGVSTVRVQFNWGADIGQGAVDVLQLVERAQQNFPIDPTLSPPIVFKYDPSTLPILQFGVSGIDDPTKLLTLIQNEVSPLIESANGVAAATVSGGATRAIVIDVDPARMRALNVSLNQIINRIAQENLNVPAGIAKESDTEYTIRSIGWFKSAADCGSIPVGTYNGAMVALRDVANVRDSNEEIRIHTRLNQKPCVAVMVTKQSNANTIATAQGVFDRIKEIEKLYPELTFHVAYDQSSYIAASIDDLKMNAIFGGGLAVLILLFFLRNIRSTLVVALSIPISIISTMALVYMCGFTLNTMSLGGLALATGLIVDDAVVVLENIFRHIERDKKSAFDASIEGTHEIMSAVLASTFTVMIVFLPLFLVKGQAGQMYSQFALVVIFSIAVSFLDATTVVPMLASRLIQGEAHHEIKADEHLNWLDRRFAAAGRMLVALDSNYRQGLAWAIHHRLWVIGVVAALTGFSFFLLPQIGSELMPQTDSGDFTCSVKLPPGTALSKTNEVIKRIEQILASNPDVESVLAASGTSLSLRGTTTALYSNQGSLTIKLKDDRKHSTQAVMADLRKKTRNFAGARIFPSQFDLVSMILTGGLMNIEVDIFGDDLTTLYSTAQQVIGKFRAIPGLQNLDVNWMESVPEIQWTVDRNKALEMGATFADISNTLNVATNDYIASYYQEKGFQYPIIVQLPESQRKTLPELLNIPIAPSLNNPSLFLAGGVIRYVTLSQVATPVYGIGPSEITRLDRMRYIAITGMPQGRSAGDIQADMEKILDGVQLPRGYRWDWGDNQKRTAEEFGGMGLAIFLAIALIYILLAAQFESFIHPLTVLASVPLAAIGVILGLFLTGRSFGLTAMIGMLMLVGIVVKNGILLVDYTNQLRGRGIARDEAVLTAGATRLRPILMTASAAILGMLPVALALGKGGEIQAPMATAVIGGLSTSTFFTLFIVPIVYTLFDDMEHLFRRNRAERQAASGVYPPTGNGSGPHHDIPGSATVVHPAE